MSADRILHEDPLVWIPRLFAKAHSLWLKATYPFAGFGRGVSVHYSCEIQRSHARRLRIDDSVILGREVWLNVPVPVTCPEHEPAIVIRDRARLGRRSVISATNYICIEEDVLLAPGVFITDHNHQYCDPDIPIWKQGTTHGGTVLIEKNCWLGYGSMVLSTKGNLVLGRNSVVGAYSVVTQSCPPNSVLVGNPARIVKQFDSSSGKWLRRDDGPKGATASPTLAE